MNFNKYKKIISRTTITLFIFLVFATLLFFPRANVFAIFVPTNDIPNNAKESIWDRAAFYLANTLIEQSLVSMTNWINRGFQGGPAFVTDPRGFLLDIADAETAFFIEELGLTDLCSPWKLDIRIALALPSGQFSRKVECTLSDIVANMDDFINGDFSQGGWAGWFELTTKPHNNPYGLYLITTSELDQRIAGIQQEQTQILNWGNGFFSQKKCQTVTVAGPTTSGGNTPTREVCEIVTPGSVVEEQLNNVLYSGQRRLEFADEFNEVISALFSQLLQQLFGGLSGGGLRSLPSYTGGGGFGRTQPSLLQDLMSKTAGEVDREILDETSYRNVKQISLNFVLTSENLLLQLAECYEGKLTDSSLNLTQAEKTLAQTRKDDASTTITAQITPTKTALENDIVLSDNNLTTLNTLRSDVTSATNISVLNVLIGDFVNLQNSGVLNTQDIFTAQQEQNTIVVQMNSLDLTTQTQITECQAFPPPLIPSPTP